MWLTKAVDVTLTQLVNCGWSGLGSGERREVLVGVPLAHGQVLTVLFNLFDTCVHLLHAFCTMYI